MGNLQPEAYRGAVGAGEALLPDEHLQPSHPSGRESSAWIRREIIRDPK